jgi:integrase
MSLSNSPKPSVSSHRIPKYCRHRASGQAYVTLGGRDVYLGVFNSRDSRQEYDRKIAEWMAAGRQVPADPQSVTVAEIIAAYRKHCRQYYLDADGTVGRATVNIDEALKPLFRLYGKTPAAEFGPLKLKAVRQQMISHGRVRTNVNRHVTRVRGMFKWAVENELIPAAVFHGLLAVSGLRAGRSGVKEGEPVRPVPIPDVEAVLAFLSAQVKAMVQLQLLTGMRPGEVVIMRGSDIDTSGPLWVYTPARHKTQNHGHTRAVYLGPKAQDIILAFFKTDLAAYLFSPADAEADRRDALRLARKTPHSCGNRAGTNRRNKPMRKVGDRYTVLSYYNAIRRACDDAFPAPDHLHRMKIQTGKTRHRSETLAEWKKRLGEKGWAELKAWRADHRWFPHQLRHTAATELRKQHGLEAAQVILGHKTLTVTQVYAEKNVEAAKRVMTLVG